MWIGGDEFVVVRCGVFEDDFVELGNCIVSEVGLLVWYKSYLCCFGVSVGVVLGMVSSFRLSILFNNVDFVFYWLKKFGWNKIIFFDVEMVRVVMVCWELLDELEEVFFEYCFVLYFMFLVDVEIYVVFGFEVFVWWDYLVKGILIFFDFLLVVDIFKFMYEIDW